MSPSLAFCASLPPARLRAAARTPVCAALPHMCARPSAPPPTPAKLELDALLAPLSPPTPLPANPANPDAAEDAYRAAKAAYKAAKASGAENDVYLSTKATYKAAKALRKGRDPAAYHAAKELRKADKRRRKLLERPSPAAVAAPPPHVAVATTPQRAVTVCGGKTCKRLGADAVAHVLRRAKGSAPDAVAVDAPCMSMCGGVGPTVDFAGRKVKVDFRAAVLDAVDAHELDNADR